MASSSDTLVLALIVDATAETARAQGQGIRDSRAEAERLEVQRAADARRREIRQAFSNAWGRCVLLVPMWLFLCFLIAANNFMDNPFAEGSYAVTTWTFILAVAAMLVIDLAVGRGADRWFMIGGAAGFVLSAWYTFSRPAIGHHPVDVSMFWLTGFLGVMAYLASALRAQQSGG